MKNPYYKWIENEMKVSPRSIVLADFLMETKAEELIGCFYHLYKNEHKLFKDIYSLFRNCNDGFNALLRMKNVKYASEISRYVEYLHHIKEIDLTSKSVKLLCSPDGTWLGGYSFIFHKSLPKKKKYCELCKEKKKFE